MRRIRFGRTNVEVPVISLGTWGHGGPNISQQGVSVGWAGHDDSKAREALIEAHARGITHWDTADVYGRGHAEELIGGVWDAVPRKEIFLATKVGWDPGGLDHFYDPEVMRRNMERSLRLLKTDAVDLMYLHHCDFGPDDRYFDGALEVVRRFREEGKTRFIGLSDWEAPKIMRFIERVDPDVVQPYRNVVDDEYESSGLRAWVDAHDLGVAFFSPLKHGLLLGKYDRAVKFPEGDFRSNVPEFGDEEFVARTRRARTAIMERYPDEPEPVLRALTGALLAHASTGCVLVGMRNRQQVDAAASAGAELTREEADWVRGLYGQA